MRRFKKPFIFLLIIFPIAVIAIIFTCLYQFELYPPEMLEEAVAQLGSRTALIVISVLQSGIMVLFCSFFGYILADRTGLWKPIKIEKNKTLLTVLISAGMGALFSLDYWTFGNAIDGIKEATAAGMTMNGILASVLYGGIVEEILLRLFFLSLVAFLIWRLFFRKTEKEKLPTSVFIMANLIAALCFAAGHLPATVGIFGRITPLILIRCFLLNGGFGLYFGWLYRKYGIWYAMMAHALMHIVSKTIWFIFI